MPGEKKDVIDPEILVARRLHEVRKQQPNGKITIPADVLFAGISRHQRTRLMTEIGGVLVNRAKGRGNGQNYVVDEELTEVSLWRWCIRPPLSSQHISEGIVKRRGNNFKAKL